MKKKTMKFKIQNLFIVVAVLAATMAQAQFTYITTNGAITITGYHGPGGAVNIPATIIGLPVAGIGDFAFDDQTNITRVTIPNSVAVIGDEAFHDCYSLTNVAFGNGVLSIGVEAFDATFLKSVMIPDSVISVGDEAFKSASLTNVSIGRGVSAIGLDAFECPDLKAITVSDQNSAFSSLDGVLFDKSQATLVFYPEAKSPSYTIPDSVTVIGRYAFQYCAGLTNVTLGTNLSEIGEGAFYSSGLTTVIIPGNVTNIGQYAFITCTSLTNAIIGDGVTSIGDYAFWGSTPLTSITIPASVKSIGFQVFGGPINVAPQNPAYSSRDGVLFNKDQTQLIQFPEGRGGSYVVPEGVTSIGDSSFIFSSITSVTLPASVTNIGQYAFGNGVLTNVFFLGDAPGGSDTSFWVSGFDCGGCGSYENATAYYLPGTAGWDTNFFGLPTALWFLPQPLILRQGPGFGMQSNQFGFTISWATNASVVVEACTNLSNPAWIPVSTNMLIGGASYFNDPQPANLPGRFYRLRSP